MTTSSLINYVRDVLQYSLFNNPDQNNEYDIVMNDKGLLFLPIYPITFVIDEAFYSKLFNILSLALTPHYTVIRPLTMQIITIDNDDISRSRGLLFPIRKGRPERIVGSFKDLLDEYYRSGNIPIMQNYNWNYVKAPHALISGVSGSGKSYFIKCLYKVCVNVGKVIAVDPKGSDLARLAKRENKEAIIPEFLDQSDDHGMSSQFLQGVVKRLKEIEKIMYERQSRLYRKSRRISTDYRELGMQPYFIFIDEVAALMTNSNKRISSDFKNVLTRLILLGREAGIYLVLAMQSARAEYIPTIVRDSISLRVQLGRINSENTRFLFPELTDMPMIPLGGKGTGIISIAGDDRYAGIEPLATPTIIEGE